jgi:hypothetical protein
MKSILQANKFWLLSTTFVAITIECHPLGLTYDKPLIKTSLLSVWIPIWYNWSYKWTKCMEALLFNFDGHNDDH